MRYLLVFPAICLLTSVGFSATIYVPDHFAKIQDAINASANGDTIIVRPGTYRENIDFVGRAIVLRGEYNGYGSVIDGTRSGSVVTFKSGEGALSVITGFAIKNGSGTYDTVTNAIWGGGIFCDAGSSPTIWENAIKANDAERGGGIGCLNGSCPDIVGNWITENSADEGGGANFQDCPAGTVRNNSIHENIARNDGGGMAATVSSLSVTGNEFSENRAEGQNSNGAGGGLIFGHARLFISENKFRKNTCVFKGGAIYGSSAQATIENNEIIENVSDSSTGGISLRFMEVECSVSGNIIAHNNSKSGSALSCAGGFSPLVTKNVISGNLGGGFSCSKMQDKLIFENNVVINNIQTSVNSNCAGIYCLETDLLAANCMVFGNYSLEYGAGIKLGQNSTSVYVAEIVNCTVANNIAAFGGGGLSAFGYQVDVYNSILWQNAAVLGSEIYFGDKHNPTNLTLGYTNIENGSGSVYCSSNCAYVVGPGVIGKEPMFADSKSGDLHLSYLSPCIDAGDNSHAGMLSADYESDPRIVKGTIDMGADEYFPHLYSVGTVTPGLPFAVKLVGIPGAPAMLGMTRDVRSTPVSTSFGDLWLTMPLSSTWALGPFPSTGVLSFAVTPNASWHGKQYHCQAIVGPLGGVKPRLTNLITLATE